MVQEKEAHRGTGLMVKSPENSSYYTNETKKHKKTDSTETGLKISGIKLIVHNHKS